MQSTLAKIVEGTSLTTTEAEAIMGRIMAGELTESQAGALLVALRMKGETAQEIAGFARAMRSRAVLLPGGPRPYAVDTCGTGGDGKHTFNISTAAALVTAAAGVPVAKHGNRSVSSRCGSADVLQALGVNVEASHQVVADCLDEVGIGFLFAPLWHPAMRNIAPIRRDLGLRTVFNILGPLTNPAGVQAQVIGVFSKDLVRKMAEVLRELGSAHAMVVHAADGSDELSLSGPTTVCELIGGELREYRISPGDVGLSRQPAEALAGGDPDFNARAMASLLARQPGAIRDAVLLSAAAALVVGEAAPGFREGIQMAAEAIDSGRAQETLAGLVRVSNRVAAA